MKEIAKHVHAPVKTVSESDQMLNVKVLPLSTLGKVKHVYWNLGNDYRKLIERILVKKQVVDGFK